jgi:hypothetical protein
MNCIEARPIAQGFPSAPAARQLGAAFPAS